MAICKIEEAIKEIETLSGRSIPKGINKGVVKLFQELQAQKKDTPPGTAIEVNRATPTELNSFSSDFGSIEDTEIWKNAEKIDQTINNDFGQVYKLFEMVQDMSPLDLDPDYKAHLDTMLKEFVGKHKDYMNEMTVYLDKNADINRGKVSLRMMKYT
jgi:hypothetical protein